MPRKIVDYSKTVMYKIVCNDLNIEDCYIGHTTDFTKRKNHHKLFAKAPHKGTNENCKVYSIIRANGGWDNWTMVEIEKFPCLDGNEARARERYWYETTNSNLNDRCPYKRLINDSIRSKQWRENNKDFICTCGKKITRGNINRHQNSQFHILNSQQST